MMLNFKEAVHFLSTVLGVQYQEEKKQNDPLGFLNEIIHAFHLNVPFQSITLMSKPTHLRNKPTLEEIKEDVMSKRGGLCYTLNSFMKYLLEALGYKAYHVTSHINAPNAPDTSHLATVVEIQTIKYLVDVGIGYPTFEAIPLNFEKESPIYQESFLEYKFTRGGPDRFTRMHKKVNGYEFVPSDDLWTVIYTVDIRPRELEFFNQSMSLLYSTVGNHAIPYQPSSYTVSYRWWSKSY